MAKLAVQIVGDAAGLKAALGQSTAATEEWARASQLATVKVADSFKGVSTAALQAQVAQDKLAMSFARYGEGTLGAAQATIRYRQQIEQLNAASLASFRSVGRNLTTYVTLPTAAIGYEAAKMGIQFQRQMLLIQTQAGASAEEVKRLSGEVLKLAGPTATAPEELAKGLYHLESVGLHGAQAIGTLKESAIAAGMGIANLESVTTALGASVVSGIQGAQNYQTAMATLNATVGAGNMRMEDLAGALGNVLASAKNAGVTLPELGAAMATLTDRGMSADEAATRLRMTFALMQAPTVKAQKALKDMGIDADTMATTLHGPNGLLKVLQMLHDAMQNVGDVRGARDILQAFGGGRSGAGILTLVQSLDSAVSSYQQKLQQVGNTSDYVSKKNAYLNSDYFKMRQALADLEASLTKLGEKMAPVLVGGADAVKTLAQAFAALPGPVKEELGIIIGLLAVGGPLMIGLAAVKRAIGQLGFAFTEIGPQAAAGAAGAETALAGVGSSAIAAEGEVAGLRSGLLSLNGMVIALTFTAVATPELIKLMHWAGHGIAHSFPGTSGTGNGPLPSSSSQMSPDDLAAAGANLGPHTADYYRHHLDEARKLVDANMAKGANNVVWGGEGTGWVDKATGKRVPGQINFWKQFFASGNRGRPRMGQNASSSPGVYVPPNIKTTGGGPTTHKVPIATQVAEAELALARGDPRAKQQLIAALRAEIASDERARVTATGTDLQKIIADETAAYNEINSLNQKTLTATNKAARERAAAARKAAAAAKRAAEARVRAAEKHHKKKADAHKKAEELAKKAKEEAKKRSDAAQQAFMDRAKIELAQASLLGGKAGLAKTKEIQAEIRKHELAIYAAEEDGLRRRLHDKELTLHQQAALWEELANIDKRRVALLKKNETKPGGAPGYVPESAAHLTAGLGLSHAQRQLLDQRISQIEAHRGTVPIHPASSGVVIQNMHVTLSRKSGKQQLEEVIAEARKLTRNNVVQRTGRHGGTRAGV